MRPGDDISEEVRRFVLVSIPSVPHLEALLLLRANSDEDWNSAKLAHRLYLSPKQAEPILQDLADAGLVVRGTMGPDSYRYDETTELEQTISSLAHSYASRLIEVTNLIHSSTGRKAQRFADAFKLRKD